MRLRWCGAANDARCSLQKAGFNKEGLKCGAEAPVQEPKDETVTDAFANVRESGRSGVVPRADRSPALLNHESQVLFETFQQPQIY